MKGEEKSWLARFEVIDTLAAITMSYGFMLVVSNRTRYTLFLNQVAYSRLNLGIAFFAFGWCILFIRTVKPSSSQRKRRRR